MKRRKLTPRSAEVKAAIEAWHAADLRHVQFVGGFTSQGAVVGDRFVIAAVDHDGWPTLEIMTLAQLVAAHRRGDFDDDKENWR